MFWNAPTAYMHAATDIEWVRSHFTLTSDENGCLAVLHNRNKMVTTFGNSEWVTQAEGSVQSKSVTSCAGMTAHLVLLAQTRVGFLSGGRSKYMRDLTPAELLAQLEEAYARATVALTRAQKLCIIMGPLDMRGLMGAATVIGCLKYGAGLCGMDATHRTVEVYLRESSIDSGPDDCSFLASLRRSLANAQGVYPPVALAEIYCENPRSSVRLHLIVVDLAHSRRISKQVYWQFIQFNLSVRTNECFNTLPVPITDSDCQHKCRFVYGFSTDGSDQPSYLLWPRRGPEGHFWLVDPISGNDFDPAMVDYVAPIGLEHFFDAFALVHKREFREAAAEALDIPLEEIQSNLVVGQSCARRFQLTPICVPDDPPAKQAKRNKEPASPAHDVSSDAKVEQESSTESDSDSSASNSDFSSEDGSSDASDLDKFEEAFAEFGKLTEGVDVLDFDRNLAGNTSDDVPGLPLEGGL